MFALSAALKPKSLAGFIGMSRTLGMFEHHESQTSTLYSMMKTDLHLYLIRPEGAD